MIQKYNKQTLHDALKLLNEGQVVGMPTESVYGLAADATNDLAIARIYETKGRPVFNPLIIHVDSIEMAREWGEFTPLAEKLIDIFWRTTPRSLTLVLKRNNEKLSHLVTAGLDTVAIRVPMHPIAQELIKNFKKPLAAPSANKSNHISPTTAEAVNIDLGALIPLIIDGGSCEIGLESTILDVTSTIPILLRPGGTTLEEIEDIIKTPILRFEETKILPHIGDQHPLKAPGMMKRHYAPSTPLRLDIVNPNSDEAYLAFGKTNVKNTMLNLSESGDLMEAATNLFKMMRLLDHPSNKSIAVAPIPNVGIGLAINDRLNRAACV